MSTTMKLTPELLRRIVREEKARIVAEAKKKVREAEISSDATEIDADGFGKDSTLEKKVDHAKAAGVKNEAVRLEQLTLEEAKLLRRLRAIRESKNRAKANIKRNI